MSEHISELEQTAMLLAGLLRGEEAKNARAHMLECPQCLEEYAVIGDVMHFTGIASEAQDRQANQAVARVKSRVMREVRGENRGVRESRGGRLQNLWQALALCSFAAIGALGGYSWNLHTEMLQMHVKMESQQSQIAALAAPDQRRFENAHAVVMMNRDGIYVAPRNLPPLPAGHVFQAWTLSAGKKKMRPDVMFVPSQRGMTLVKLANASSKTLAVAVSIEPMGGSAQPTSPPVFVQMLKTT